MIIYVGEAMIFQFMVVSPSWILSHKTLNLKSKQQQGFRTIEKVWNQPNTLRERTAEGQYICMMVVSNNWGLSQIVGCCLTKIRFSKHMNHELSKT